jgi:hypothetical protein
MFRRGKAGVSIVLLVRLRRQLRGSRASDFCKRPSIHATTFCPAETSANVAFSVDLFCSRRAEQCLVCDGVRTASSLTFFEKSLEKGSPLGARARRVELTEKIMEFEVSIMDF